MTGIHTNKHKLPDMHTCIHGQSNRQPGTQTDKQVYIVTYREIGHAYRKTNRLAHRHMGHIYIRRYIQADIHTCIDSYSQRRGRPTHIHKNKH